jgi:uncharacterized membrane protein YkoI
MKNQTLMVLAIAAMLAVGGCAKDKGETEEPMALDSLPAAVKAGFDKDFPGATVRGVEKEQYPDGAIHYEIEFTTKDGKKMDQEFDATGHKLAKH